MGLDNNATIAMINKSGSVALADSNEYGIHVFGSGSSGVVSGRLLRAGYNIPELKRSVDLSISELIPIEQPVLEDTVLRSIYNAATQSILDLTNEVQVLNNSILELRSKVVGLEIVSESLKIELDGERLKAGINENQAFVANNQLASTIIDLQNAIQTSLNESIERVSLSARNQVLVSENENLRNQLFGISTQLSGGAVASANNTFTAKFTGLGDDGDTLFAYAAHKGLPSSARFRSANKVQVNNVLSDVGIRDVKFELFDGERWFRVVSDSTGIGSQGQRMYDIVFDFNVLRSMRPYQKRSGIFFVWEGRSTKYEDTKLNITVTFENGNSDTLILKSFIQKDRD